MSSTRVSSSPDFSAMSTSNPEDLSLEGIAANVKLLLKLIQDHQEASHSTAMDERRSQRFAGMMTILDDLKPTFRNPNPQARKRAELRRCNTDLRASNPPRVGDPLKKKEPLILDEREKLKRDLNTSYAAQKRLGVMCASLGREKEIIVRELTRKVQELNEMEELVSDLRAQNERLSTKVQACVAEHKENKSKGVGGESTLHFSNHVALQERNKELSEQLVKSLEGYKSMKRRLKEAHEEREAMQAVMVEVGDELEVGFRQIQSLKQSVADCRCHLDSGEEEIEENVAALDRTFKRLEEKVSRYRQEGRQ